MAKCIIELERIYGIKQGNNQNSLSDNLTTKTQEELSGNIGMSRQQLQDYKKLTTLIPELQDFVSEDKLSPTIAHSELFRLNPYT